jgi:hypothetical protein
MKNFVVLLAISFLFLTGCQKEEIPVSAINGSEITIAKIKAPFQGSIKGISNVNCTNMTSEMTGQGYISYLGNYQSVSTAKLQPLSLTTGQLYDGIYTATNAHGDQLTAALTGTWEVVNTNPYEVNYVFTMVLTGGTGPFLGATGEVTIQASATGTPCSSLQFTSENVSGYIEFANLIPFKGSMTGSSVATGSCSFGPAPGETRLVSQWGNMTHFGNSSGLLEHCNALTSLSGGLIVGGEAVLEAANGDKLYFSYSGNFALDLPYPNQTSSTLAASGTITGGTGRFEGAVGTVNATGLQTFGISPTPVSIEIMGFLRY